MSEWPITNILISRGSEPLCIDISCRTRKSAAAERANDDYNNNEDDDDDNNAYDDHDYDDSGDDDFEKEEEDKETRLVLAIYNSPGAGLRKSVMG